MSFRRFVKNVDGTWTLELSDKATNVDFTKLLRNMTIEEAEARANLWLQQNGPEGELLAIHIFSLSPLNIGLYRATVKEFGQTVPVDWWVG